MLDYRFQSLGGGHLQLILLLGDGYVGLQIPVSRWRSPSLQLILLLINGYVGLQIPVSRWRSPSVNIIIRRCLCWIIKSSHFVEVPFR